MILRILSILNVNDIYYFLNKYIFNCYCKEDLFNFEKKQ